MKVQVIAIKSVQESSKLDLSLVGKRLFKVLQYGMETINQPWPCAKSLAWPCAEALRRSPNFEVAKSTRG